ncbi:hypothetical protein B0H13DRAFT_2657142 [Mycena leptocephala]|nr:hypothetical protein B0H13DRAFT_2657142 [Mycena leptocephala]
MVGALGRTPRYGGDDKAIIVMAKVRTPSRTQTPTPTWCVYSSDAPTPAPPSLVFFSGRVPAASTAPTQRPTSFSLPPPLAPCPRSAIRYEVYLICAGAFSSSNSLARALVVSPHGLQRAQDDGTTCEPQAGALAVGALDEGCPPAPGASLRILRTSSLPYPPALTLRNTYAQFAVVVVARRTSSSPHSRTSRTHPYLVPPQTPRPSLARHAPAAAFAAVHQSRPFTAPNRHPADRTIRFLIAPLTLVLMPVRPNLAFASTANRARSRVPPSICPRRSILKSQRTRTRSTTSRRRMAAGRGGRREDGVETDEGGGRTRARVSACDTCGGRIGFHNCPGVYLTTDIGRGIRWRLTLPPPLPAPPSYLNPRTHLASIPHAHRERKCEQNIHSLRQTAHTDIIPTPILPSRRHARTPRARRHPIPLPLLAHAASPSSCLPAHDELQARVEVRSACACVRATRLDQMGDLPRTARYGDGGGTEVGAHRALCAPCRASCADRRERWRRTEGIAISVHRSSRMRRPEVGYIAGRGSRERRLDGLAGSAVDACRDFEARCISGEPRGWHLGRGQAGRNGDAWVWSIARGMGATIRQSSAPLVLFSKRFLPKSPHPRLFIMARARSPMTSSSSPALPSRLQAPCTPIGPQYTLDRISLTLSAFTTCTSSRLFLSGGRLFFRSATSPAPPVHAHL